MRVHPPKKRRSMRTVYPCEYKAKGTANDVSDSIEHKCSKNHDRRIVCLFVVLVFILLVFI